MRYKPKYKRYLYHVTPDENVKSILEKGLIRGGEKSRGIAIYMSQNPLSWWTPGNKILRVDTKGLQGDWSDFLPGNDEILYWGDIPAKRIKVYEPNTVELIQMGNAYTEAIASLSGGGNKND